MIASTELSKAGFAANEVNDALAFEKLKNEIVAFAGQVHLAPDTQHLTPATGFFYSPFTSDHSVKGTGISKGNFG